MLCVIYPTKKFKYWIYSFPHISRVANTFLNFSPNFTQLVLYLWRDLLIFRTNNQPLIFK